MGTNRAEAKDRSISVVLSSLITVALILLSIFTLKWYPPNPPLSDSGVALNFGVDEAGWGEIQPELPDAAVEEATPQPTPDPAKPDDQMITSQDPQSPYEAPKQPDTTLAEPAPTEPDIAQLPKTTVPKQERTASQTKPSNANKTSPSKSSDNTNASNNHGDKPGTTGDQGSPKGSLEAKALYGTAGNGGSGGGSGSGRSSLDMAGWQWDERPQPSDQSSEEGRIVFEIQIDESGEIIKISTKERTVSPAVEKIYRREVEKLTFSRTETKNTTAAVSVGRITFIIKSK